MIVLEIMNDYIFLVYTVRTCIIQIILLQRERVFGKNVVQYVWSMNDIKCVIRFDSLDFKEIQGVH
jgi:hypothetical protein